MYIGIINFYYIRLISYSKITKNLKNKETNKIISNEFFFDMIVTVLGIRINKNIIKKRNFFNTKNKFIIL